MQSLPRKKLSLESETYANTKNNYYFTPHKLKILWFPFQYAKPFGVFQSVMEITLVQYHAFSINPRNNRRCVITPASRPT